MIPNCHFDYITKPAFFFSNFVVSIFFVILQFTLLKLHFPLTFVTTMQKLTPKKSQFQVFEIPHSFRFVKKFRTKITSHSSFFFFFFFEFRRTSGFHERAGKELVVKARFFNLNILLFLRPLSKWQDRLYDYWVPLVKVRTSSLIFVRSADQGSI